MQSINKTYSIDIIVNNPYLAEFLVAFFHAFDNTNDAIANAILKNTNDKNNIIYENTDTPNGII